MIKTLNKFGIMGAHLNIIKAIYDKFTVSIVFDGEKLKFFPLRSGIRQESTCLKSPLLLL